MRLAPALLALMLLLPLLSTLASAESNTTNITITMPVFTPTETRVWIVHAEYVDNGTLRIDATCISPGVCPNLTITVTGELYNYTFSIVNATCNVPPCRYARLLTGVPNAVTIVYRYSYNGNAVTGTITVRYWGLTGRAAFVAATVTMGLALGLAVRGDPKASAIGFIAAALLIYALAAAGLAPPGTVAVSYVFVIVAALLFWLYR